eukprot:TRINITY_DN2070_c0_g2_i3.p1 TRINITY_DN2070_c0_g2~~TRINITY_DN2070_c0_g2_i3.p1  ORF type:complete len:431 (+),score=114.21 TRINITY_DN2070_c0_g2_i3:28-1320(+)
MSSGELRHRKKSDDRASQAKQQQGNTTDEDSDNDGSATPARGPPSSTTNAPAKGDGGGWGVRTRWTIILLITFFVLIAIGHPTLTLLVMVCQMFMYKEIVAIGFKWNKEKELPLFRTLNWYFYFCITFEIYSKALGSMILETPGLASFFRYPIQFSSLIFYSGFCIGIVLFVLTLKKNFYKYQFQQLAWTGMAILLVVFPTTFIISNMYQGIIWFILPALLVVANDCWAFFFGKLFGRTPLIQLSPKKTWEGFIGATLATFVFGFFLPVFFTQYQYLICPKTNVAFGHPVCTPDPVFLPVTYKFPEHLAVLLKLPQFAGFSIQVRPIQWIGVIFAAFASIIAPFGGFLASGFKRAYGVKDFGDSIPGHGGVTDRMDCQVLMGVFVYVFCSSFVKSPDVHTVVDLFVALADVDQLNAFFQIREILVMKGLI